MLLHLCQIFCNWVRGFMFSMIYRATWHTLSEMPAEIMNDDDSVGSRTPLDSISVISNPLSQDSEEVIIEGTGLMNGILLEIETVYR